MDPLDRIREAKDDKEALELTLAEIADATWTPRMTLPELRRRIALALKALRERPAAKP